MKFLKNWLLATVFALSFGGAFGTILVPATASAACSSGKFLTFPAWYDGLVDGSCDIKSPDTVGGLSPFIWKIVTNVIEIALQAVAYISVGFIIYGGYLYMIGAGSADKMVNARKTILNAVVGLVISFFSVVAINLIASRF